LFSMSPNVNNKANVFILCQVDMKVRQSTPHSQPPAAQGQSRNSLRCDGILETCGHYIYD
jgi:hypothetical protein